MYILRLIKRIFAALFRPFYNYYIVKQNNSRIEPNSLVLFNTKLEGANYVGEKTELYCSYLGYASYISWNCEIRSAKIGKFCSIGPRVKIVIGKHPTEFVSTYPAFYKKIQLRELTIMLHLHFMKLPALKITMFVL